MKNSRIPSPEPIAEQSPTIQLPKNYSGNAFTADGQMRKILDEPTRDIAPPEEEKRIPHLSESVSPTFTSSHKSALGYSDYPIDEPMEKSAPENANIPYEEKKIEPPRNDGQPTVREERSSSLLSSMLGGNFGENFPFGHGIGAEELLILGVMLAIYLSEKRDSELMMLLGILLFAG